MDNEEYSVFVDEVSGTVNSICKDFGMMDRFMYIVIKNLWTDSKCQPRKLWSSGQVLLKKHLNLQLTENLKSDLGLF